MKSRDKYFIQLQAYEEECDFFLMKTALIFVGLFFLPVIIR